MEAAAPPLTEGLLAHAHFNHDPLHCSSQDKKEGQEPVDAESLLPGHPLQSSPHLGPEEHDRGLRSEVRAEPDVQASSSGRVPRTESQDSGAAPPPVRRVGSQWLTGPEHGRLRQSERGGPLRLSNQSAVGARVLGEAGPA